MKNNIGKNIGIGFLVGVIANMIGSYLYLFFLSMYKKLSLESTYEVTMEQGLLGNVIVLGALLNLGVFFIFLKKKRYYRARGVIMATLVAALLVLASKFL